MKTSDGFTRALESSFDEVRSAKVNLIQINRVQNQKQLRFNDKRERTEHLYTDHMVRNANLERIRIAKKGNDEVHYSFEPEINPKSREILSRTTDKMLSRTYNWNEDKNEKLKEMRERHLQAENKKIEDTLTFRPEINANHQVMSKVKQHVVKLDDTMTAKQNRVPQTDPHFFAENETIQRQVKKPNLLALENKRKKQVDHFLNTVSLGRELATPNSQIEHALTKAMIVNKKPQNGQVFTVEKDE